MAKQPTTRRPRPVTIQLPFVTQEPGQLFVRTHDLPLLSELTVCFERLEVLVTQAYQSVLKVKQTANHLSTAEQRSECDRTTTVDRSRANLEQRQLEHLSAILQASASREPLYDAIRAMQKMLKRVVETWRKTNLKWPKIWYYQALDLNFLCASELLRSAINVFGEKLCQLPDCKDLKIVVEQKQLDCCKDWNDSVPELPDSLESTENVAFAGSKDELAVLMLRCQSRLDSNGQRCGIELENDPVFTNLEELIRRFEAAGWEAHGDRIGHKRNHLLTIWPKKAAACR